MRAEKRGQDLNPLTNVRDLAIQDGWSGRVRVNYWNGLLITHRVGSKAFAKVFRVGSACLYCRSITWPRARIGRATFGCRSFPVQSLSTRPRHCGKKSVSIASIGRPETGSATERGFRNWRGRPAGG